MKFSLFSFTCPHFWQAIYYSQKKKTWSFKVGKCREEQNETSSCSYRRLASARGDLARLSSLSWCDLSTRQHGSKKGGIHDVCTPKINSCSLAKAKCLLLMHLTQWINRRNSTCQTGRDLWDPSKQHLIDRWKLIRKGIPVVRPIKHFWEMKFISHPNA